MQLLGLVELRGEVVGPEIVCQQGQCRFDQLLGLGIEFLQDMGNGEHGG